MSPLHFFLIFWKWGWLRGRSIWRWWSTIAFIILCRVSIIWFERSWMWIYIIICCIWSRSYTSIICRIWVITRVLIWTRNNMGCNYTWISIVCLISRICVVKCIRDGGVICLHNIFFLIGWRIISKRIIHNSSCGNKTWVFISIIILLGGNNYYK